MRKVITYGVFDLFHEGHLNLLTRARELGDHLTVAVTTNLFDELRGKLDTVDSLQTRMSNVAATGLADEVIVEDHAGQKLEDITKRNIDVLVAGSDWEGKFDYLRSVCDVVYLTRTPGVSSSQLRHELLAPLRIGIIGSGRIAARFCREARTVDSVHVEAVYNPHIAGARDLATTESIPFATDSIDELLGRVDAVYVASPHETHATYASKALAHGKHVLCEKPMALSEQEARSLFETARERGLVLIEALKTAYCPGYARVVEAVESGAIGEVVDIQASFTRLTGPGCREMDDPRYGGSFLEFGSYTLLPVFQLLGTDYSDLRFDTVIDERGVDLYTRACLTYGADLCPASGTPQRKVARVRAMAEARTGLGAKTSGELVVAGTDGYIVVPAPWWKTSRMEVHHEATVETAADVWTEDYAFLGDGLRYEISEFSHLVNGHEGRRTKLTPEISIAIAGVIERYRNRRDA